MRTKSLLLSFILVFLASSTVVSASDPLGWSGQGEAGYQKASGNTDSETLNLGLAFLWTNQDWSNDFDLSVYKSSNSGSDSANSMEASYTLKRDLTERSNLFFSLTYLDDEFDGFDRQSSASAGYGYKVLDTETVTWETSVGLGYRDAKQVILPELGSADAVRFLDVGGATGVLRSLFKTQLTDNTDFKWSLKSEIGSDNTFIQSDAALLVAMNGRFSLKAQLLVRHNSEPAPTLDKTDTISLLSLVYNFGEQNASK